MLGWCDFYHTEVGDFGFNSPCGNCEECVKCSAYHNLTIENNEFDVDKKE